MKLSGKIGWVSLNSVSKKLFEFDSNIFRRFKDHFFKVLATGVVTDGMPLMFNRDRVSRFPFYWKSNPTRFKSYGEDLLTLAEKVDKAIWSSCLPRWTCGPFYLFLR